MLTYFRGKCYLYTLGIASLRQTDVPGVLASVSVLDLNYLYLRGSIPSAKKRRI